MEKYSRIFSDNPWRGFYDFGDFNPWDCSQIVIELGTKYVIYLKLADFL